MNRDRVVRILKVMTIAILALFLGLVVAIGMLKNCEAEIRRAEQRNKFIEENALERVRDLIKENGVKMEALKQDHLKELEDLTESFGLQYVGEYKCTAYCTEKYEHICGEGHGITASGQPVQAGVSVAVGDTDKFPYGTVLYIEGVGIRIVQDTGGGLKDNQIDVAIDTHENALRWNGYGDHKVYVVKVGEGK